MLVVTISLTLVLLPIAINVGTGGTAPAFLAPYVGWTWPAIGVLWLIAIVTGAGGVPEPPDGRTLGRSADQPRNRPNALARVDRYLADRFAGSLAPYTNLALALDEQSRGGRPPVRPARPAAQRHRRRGPRERRHRHGLRRPPGLHADPRRTRRRQDHPAAGACPHPRRAGHQLIPTHPSRSSSTWPAGPAATVRQEDDDPRRQPAAGRLRPLAADRAQHRYQIPAAVGRVWLRTGRLAPAAGRSGRNRPRPPREARPVLPDLQQNYRSARLAVTCRIHDYEQLATPPQAVRRRAHPPADPATGARLLRRCRR